MSLSIPIIYCNYLVPTYFLDVRRNYEDLVPTYRYAQGTKLRILTDLMQSRQKILPFTTSNSALSPIHFLNNSRGAVGNLGMINSIYGN